MFRILNFLVRNPNMTPEEFRYHYETSHVPMALDTFPQIQKHVRYYATDGGAMFPEGIEQPYDAIVAITLADRKGFDDMMAYLVDDAKPRDIVEDGEKFLDGAKCGMLIVEESVTTR